MSSSRQSPEFLEDIRQAANKAVEFLGPLSLAEFSIDDKTVSPSFALWKSWERQASESRRICESDIRRFLGVQWPVSAINSSTTMSL
jgi:hypothetical protein